MKTYNKYNFHKYTFCIFKEVSESEIENLKMNFVSKSGSSYIFTDEGVYRKSNHWGRAANCKWRLQTNGLNNFSKVKLGYANWNEFHPIDEVSKLYFIEVDFKNKTVQYLHKNLSVESENYLRNASETTKRVKEIRHLFSNQKKLEYWQVTDGIDSLLINVTKLMISTDCTLLQIKQKILNQ